MLRAQTDLERIARVSYVREMAIISLICNLDRTSEILERVFRVLKREGINVKMMSQVRRLPGCFTALERPRRSSGSIQVHRGAYVASSSSHRLLAGSC